MANLVFPQFVTEAEVFEVRQLHYKLSNGDGKIKKFKEMLKGISQRSLSINLIAFVANEHTLQ